jgi:release factor glutamine methyltransferase
VSPSTASDSEVWSIRRVIAWAADYLTRRGNETGRLDAELLLGRVLKLDRIALIMHAERPLSPSELHDFRELFKRRRAGEPIAYLLGEREFFGIPLRVDKRVLIPRPDTERLVEVALERTRARSMLGAALDLCTGSGCVAIAFARARPTWSVAGIDVSPDALAVAADNAKRTGAVRNLRLLEGSLFGPVPGQRFDLITANPPYIPTAELAELPLDVRGFEPHLALDGGADGLDLVREIAEQAQQHLTGGGLLALEIGADQGPRTIEILRERGYVDVELARDLGGRDRVVSGYGPP